MIVQKVVYISFKNLFVSFSFFPFLGFVGQEIIVGFLFSICQKKKKTTSIFASHPKAEGVMEIF